MTSRCRGRAYAGAPAGWGAALSDALRPDPPVADRLALPRSSVKTASEVAPAAAGSPPGRRPAWPPRPAT